MNGGTFTTAGVIRPPFPVSSACERAGSSSPPPPGWSSPEVEVSVVVVIKEHADGAVAGIGDADKQRRDERPANAAEPADRDDNQEEDQVVERVARVDCQQIGAQREEVVRLSFLAGNDLILTTEPPDWSGGLDYFGILTKLAESDPKMAEQLDAAVRRVLRLKDRLGLLDGL